jgi:hypothetical protein
MIRTERTPDDKVQITIDNSRGTARAILSPRSALSLRQRLDLILTDILDAAIDEGRDIAEEFA